MGVTRYTEVESRFVREQIVEGSYDDAAHRAYVDDLVRLERYVREGPSGFGAGMHYGKLRNRYPAEHDAIQEELDPEAYAARKRRAAERRAELERVRGEDDGSTALERREWEQVREAFEPR